MTITTINLPVSHRAKKALQAAASNHMWEVLDDPWNPLTNPTGCINVGVAENTLMQQYLLDFLNSIKIELPAESITYDKSGGGSLRLKHALCGFLNRHLHPAVSLTADHLLVTNGVSPALEHIAWGLADPGDGFLLGRPYYSFFAQDLCLRAKARIVTVDFNDVDPLGPAIVERYERAMLAHQRRTGRHVKGLLLCNPHNPLGRCYSRDVMIGLMRLCQRYRIHLICDESFALSTWENTVDNGPRPVPFVSVLSIGLDGIIDPSLVHSLWGASKDLDANGVRLGVLISQANPDLHLALKGPSIYSQVSGITDHFMSLVLEDAKFTNAYIRQNQQKLSEAYAYAVGFLKSHDVEHAPGCNAAFFLWLNLGKKYRTEFPGMSKIGDVGEVVMQRLLQHGVCLNSGVSSGSEEDGWFRFVFSHPRPYVQEALERIIAALQP